MWDSIKNFFVAVWNFIAEAFISLWEGIVNLYEGTIEFVYGIFPGQLGDLVLALIGVVVLVFIVKAIGFNGHKK